MIRKCSFFSLFNILMLFFFVETSAVAGDPVEAALEPYKTKSLKTLRTESISGDWKAQLWFATERDSHETAAMKKEAIKWWVSALQNPNLDLPAAKTRLIEKIANKIQTVSTIISMGSSEKEYLTKNHALLKAAAEGNMEAKFRVGLDYYEERTDGALRPDLGFPLIKEAALKGHKPAVDFLCTKAKELYGIKE